MEKVSRGFVDLLLSRELIVVAQIPAAICLVASTLSFVTTTAVVIIIGIISQALYETMIFSAVYWFLRSTVGGYHSKKYHHCLIISTTSVMMFIIFLKLFSGRLLYISLVLLACCIICSLMCLKIKGNDSTWKSVIFFPVSLLMSLLVQLTALSNIENILYSVAYAIFFASFTYFMRLGRNNREKGMCKITSENDRQSR